MPDLGFLRSRPARILTIVLALQASVFYGTSRREEIPSIRPLSEFPVVLGDWSMTQEGYVDEETQAVLRADDTLTRVYASPGEGAASLFIAFFKTQRSGQAPHSPKNCLPGSGWEVAGSGVARVDVPGRAEPVEVNIYEVAKGDNRSVVLYWYQSRDRIVASEYEAKMWLVADAIRYNRTDTSLVRVVVPVQGADRGKAIEKGRRFIQSAFPALMERLPS
ncbi:MAG: EpsI family protein [Bryobacterales bacterium]|jgi:EpsI family protein|nr:EpsI family protein [Bryobacterales bacterium]